MCMFISYKFERVNTSKNLDIPSPKTFYLSYKLADITLTSRFLIFYLIGSKQYYEESYFSYSK